MTLEKILMFITGSQHEPLLGFKIQPTIKFAELPGNLPTANTCINCLTIPCTSTVDKEKMFENFDLAFTNTYFGFE